ncbi:MAG: hypothetical protein N2248_00485 [candidate division WOR-3 bacterium]|nr:hypothetical protein [candidate division WOR-3 bacterium]
MTLLDRLLAALPPFLRPHSPSGVTHHLLSAIATAFQTLQTQFRLLRARGAIHRWDPEFVEYYASDKRKDDIARIAVSRLLSKRSNETWEQFEQRVQNFLGSENWADPSHQNYTVTGDISRWGSGTGITLELEHTGLKVDAIYPGGTEHDQWKVWDKEHEPSDPLELAKTYDLGHEPPSNQRLTKLYSLHYLDWTFYIILSNPQNIDYSPDEIKTIVKLTKPVWTQAMAKLPDSETWTRII